MLDRHWLRCLSFQKSESNTIDDSWSRQSDRSTHHHGSKVRICSTSSVRWIIDLFSAILGARKHEGPRRLIKDRAYARLELFFFDLILLWVLFDLWCNDAHVLSVSRCISSKDQMERWFKFKLLKCLVYFGYVPEETGALIEEFR